MYNTNCDPTKLKEKESRRVVYTSYTQLTVCCVTNYICLLYQLYLVFNVSTSCILLIEPDLALVLQLTQDRKQGTRNGELLVVVQW